MERGGGEFATPPPVHVTGYGRSRSESRRAELKPSRRTTYVRVNVQKLYVKQADDTKSITIPTHFHRFPWGFPEDVKTSALAIWAAVWFGLVCLNKNRTFIH